MKHIVVLLIASALAVALVGCSSAPSTEAIRLDAPIDMTIEFVDPGWDGETIPVSGRCVSCGGHGRSPAMRVGGLPPEVNEIIVEFNDLRIKDLAKNGGHGTLGYATGGREEAYLPSVREETMSLPKGVRSVRKHQCVFYGHKSGAYKAPCGCGQGNDYVAVVKAVHREGDDIQVLARKTVPMGLF